MVSNATPEHDESIGVIVLAAGASVRMGTPKQLLIWKGQSLIRRAAQSAIDSSCRPIVIVLGANAELIYPELGDLKVHPVINLTWQKGMSSSIHCGLKALLAMAPKLQAAILMVADQPNVTGTSLKSLVEEHRQSHANLVCAHYSGQIGTPALFGCGYFDELMHLEGPGGAKRVLQHHRADLMAIDLPEAVLDLDTPHDLTVYIGM